jgi:heme-degrading monooxygenase HmoA
MIGVFVKFTMKPGGEHKLLEWKQREGELHAKAPGFLKRQMSRSVKEPNVFYFTTFWETQADIDAFKSSDAMYRALSEVNVWAEIESREVVTVTEVFDQKLGDEPAAHLPG